MEGPTRGSIKATQDNPLDSAGSICLDESLLSRLLQSNEPSVQSTRVVHGRVALAAVDGERTLQIGYPCMTRRVRATCDTFHAYELGGW